MPMAVYFWLSGAAGAIAIGSALLWFGRRIARFVSKFDNLHEDWYGKPARPEEGVDQKKGVMLRLKEQDDILNFLKHELTMNGGITTVKEVVNQQRKDIADIKTNIEVIKEVVIRK